MMFVVGWWEMLVSYATLEDLCVGVFCLLVTCALHVLCLVASEARRGCGIPWN